MVDCGLHIFPVLRTPPPHGRVPGSLTHAHAEVLTWHTPCRLQRWLTNVAICYVKEALSSTQTRRLTEDYSIDIRQTPISVIERFFSHVQY